MGYPKGRRGDSHWFKDVLWDWAGTFLIIVVLGSICVGALWIAGQLVEGIIR